VSTRILSIALDRYDRHFPFYDGTAIPPDGVEFDVKQVGQGTSFRDGSDRHGRMIHNNEFDISEFSMSSYLMAKARNLPLTAIPVFPRRLFSQSQMWVHPDSDLWHPKDLIGKRVAISSFQTTLSLLAKGDLKFHYDVPWEEIHWLLTANEKVPFETKPGVKTEYIGDREQLGYMLEAGEVDAFFLPHPPHTVATGETRARHLFADSKAEELAYYKKHGDFPIMHIVVMRRELADSMPGLGRALIKTFSDARDLAEEYYEDPNWSRLAWGRHMYEEERDAFDGDPWRNGFKQNRDNIARFIKYSHDQGLIDDVYEPEELFIEDTLNT
tara:strand:+ start:51459 stop:52439 length:981 start_codon:yes stop_codon:yes gene_type:complete